MSLDIFFLRNVNTLIDIITRIYWYISNIDIRKKRNDMSVQYVKFSICQKSINNFKPSCNLLFHRVFIAKCLNFKVITLVCSNQCYWFENTTPCSKQMIKRQKPLPILTPLIINDKLTLHNTLHKPQNAISADIITLQNYSETFADN